MHVPKLIQTQEMKRSRCFPLDQSCRCSILFLSQTAPGPIGHDNLVSFFMQITPVRLVTSLSCLVFIIGRTWSNRFGQFNFDFGIYHTYQLVMSLSYLVFIIDYTRSDHTWKLSFIFDVDNTCTINLVGFLSGFHHKLHIVRQVLTFQIEFRPRLDLYDQSHYYPI